MSTMRVKSTLDSRDYKRGVKQMQKQNKGFSGGLGKIGKAMKAAFAVAAIMAVVRAIGRAISSVVNFGSKLSDLSAQTGVGVVALQKFNDAALNAGSSSEKMAKALVSLKDAQGEVLDNDKLMTDAFKNLGISIEEVTALNTEELFVRVSKALTDSGNSAKELSAVFDVLGKRNAMELIEAMNEVSVGLDKFESRNSALTEREAQRLDVMADAWERLKLSVLSTGAATLAVFSKDFRQVESEVDKRIEDQKARKERERRTRQLAADLSRADAKKRERLLEEKAAATIAKQIDNIKKSVTIEIQTNSLRRIGGFAGSRTSGALSLARQQVEIQSKIEDYTASLPQIEKNTQNQGLA